MKSVEDSFRDRMHLKGVYPPNRIKADEKIHTYKTGKGGEYWYVLSPNKPAVGFFGQCNDYAIRRWAIKRKSLRDLASYIKRSVKLKRAVTKFLRDLNKNSVSMKTVDRRTTNLKQLSLF